MKKSIFFFALLFLAISSYQLHAESDTLWTTAIGSTVRTVKFSPDGDYVYAAAEGRGPLKLDAKTGDILMEYEGVKFERARVSKYCMQLSSSGEYLYCADNGKYVYKYDTKTDKLIDSIEISIDQKINLFVWTLGLSNKYLFVFFGFTENSKIKSRFNIINLETKEIVKNIPIDDITNIEVVENKNIVAFSTALNTFYNKAYIHIYDLEKLTLIHTFDQHTGSITDLSFSPDGSRLASSDFNTYLVKIWDIEKKELLLSFKPSGTYTFSIELFDNDKLVYSGGEFIDLRLRTTKLSTKLEVNNILQKAADFKILNSKIVVAYNHIVSLLNSDRLTSVASDFTKDLLYPNPANNLLTVPKTFFGDSFVAMSITDLSGKVVYTFDNNQQIDDLIIDISAYNTGSYYLNFNYKSRSQSSRFIKE